MIMKKVNKTIQNRTRDFPVCSAVPPRAPTHIIRETKCVWCSRYKVHLKQKERVEITSNMIGGNVYCRPVQPTSGWPYVACDSVLGC
jgi:hypothetical protein